MSFSNRLQDLLHDKRLSQTEFCEITGYSKPSLSNILTGRTATPKIDVLEAIARQFPEVSLRWLVLGDGKMYGSHQPLNDMLAQEAEVPYIKDEEEAETLRELARTQKQLLHLMEKRVEQMERNIKQRDPDLARELGLEE